MPKKGKVEWGNVRIPKELAEQIRRVMKLNPGRWVSESEFARTALREKIEQLRTVGVPA
jgi:Arc/MetJ-type ribon-helix-helix transcriptional regulator